MIHCVEGDPFLLDFVVSDKVWPSRQSDAQLPSEMASCCESEHVRYHVVGVCHSSVSVEEPSHQ